MESAQWTGLAWAGGIILGIYGLMAAWLWRNRSRREEGKDQ